MPISLSQLLAWNPWLGATSASNTDCTKALFANLDYYENRAVCIGTGGVRPTVTSTTAAASTSPASTTTTSSSGPPAPTPTGVVEGCQQFHVVQDGEYCWLLQNQYGITLEQFLSWNRSRMFTFLTNLVLPPLLQALLWSPGRETNFGDVVVGSDCVVWLGYAYCVKGPA